MARTCLCLERVTWVLTGAVLGSDTSPSVVFLPFRIILVTGSTIKASANTHRIFCAPLFMTYVFAPLRAFAKPSPPIFLAARPLLSVAFLRLFMALSVEKLAETLVSNLQDLSSNLDWTKACWIALACQLLTALSPISSCTANASRARMGNREAYQQSGV